MIGLRPITSDSIVQDVAKNTLNLEALADTFAGAQMIISKTPFRISFFGGGTDYPAYYREHGGAVIGSTIDKYCYLTCRYLPPFFEHKSRIVYSKQECVMDNSMILHPPIRAALEQLNISSGIEIHHDGDLPARSGLGSSSACMVGVLNSLYALKGRRISRMDLAQRAIHVEQNVLKENVGSQDQVFAAFGGMNKILFRQNGNIDVIPLTVSLGRKKQLQNRLMFCFTRTTRIASQVAGSFIAQIRNKHDELREMKSMVDAAEVILYEGDLDDFGKLLHEAWKLKRSVSSDVSNAYLDAIYSRARAAGALGGKVIGAGGGGFMLFYVPPDRQPLVRASVPDVIWVPIGFESEGSKIIYYGE